MNFFTILLSNDFDNTITELIKENKKEVDIFRLNQHGDKIDEESIFLICIGGDKTKPYAWWLKDGNDKSSKGLKFIASLVKKPEQYDPNDNKNFKIRVKIEYTFSNPIKKEDYIYWPDSYDTDASVATKGKQTQAIGLIKDENKYLCLLRGAMYYDNNLVNFYKDFFGQDFLDKIEAPKKRFVEKSLTFSEEINLPKVDNTENKNKKIKCNYEQIIYYGVPGSGKSYAIDKIVKKLESQEPLSNVKYTRRVVFHPEYTNADFIGQILPKMEGTGIKYNFIPGHFTKILKDAYRNPTKQFALVIEEINRGNAAAIFGDVFQLLDRLDDNETDYNANDQFTYTCGWSKYGIDNTDIIHEIFKNNEGDAVPLNLVINGETLHLNHNSAIRLPPNLSIYATMNTSDQNVFTLDNAFQRRWDMQLVKNECDDSNQMEAQIIIKNKSITWKDFQEQINKVIGEKSNESGLSSMEDKRLGCWFVRAENKTITAETFANKVLKYLWDDAFKFYHSEIFKDGIKNFEELQKEFFDIGFDVFNDECDLKDKIQNVILFNFDEE